MICMADRTSLPVRELTWREGFPPEPPDEESGDDDKPEREPWWYLLSWFGLTFAIGLGAIIAVYVVWHEVAQALAN